VFVTLAFTATILQNRHNMIRRVCQRRYPRLSSERTGMNIVTKPRGYLRNSWWACEQTDFRNLAYNGRSQWLQRYSGSTCQTRRVRQPIPRGAHKKDAIFEPALQSNESHHHSTSEKAIDTSQKPCNRPRNAQSVKSPAQMQPRLESLLSRSFDLSKQFATQCGIEHL
jgi:hypothetical protein